MSRTIFHANRTVRMKTLATPRIISSAVLRCRQNFSIEPRPSRQVLLRRPGRVCGAIFLSKAPGNMLFKIIVTATIACILIAVASVVYRLQKTKPIMMIDAPEFRFSETWCSGRSDRNMLARLAVAKNILWVVVTKNELQVSPHFPFSVMFFPEVFGLDHRVPGKTITDVRETSSRSLGRGVLVKYRHATGDEENLELWASDVLTLRRALSDIRQ
jgi:hypothetical protein